MSEQSENLQGQILLWVETSLELSETQSSEYQTVLKDAIQEFQQLHPQVQIFVEFWSPRQIFELFELQAKRGAGPDLLLVQSSPQILRLIKARALKALDDSQIDQSQFRAEALKLSRYRGQLYGLPLYLSTQVLCYNQDKVKELPKTLPELIEQARKGHSVGLVSGFDQTFWGTGIFGGRLLDEHGRVVLAEGESWANWMQWLKEIQNEPNVILSDDDEALRQAFVREELTYLTCSSQWLPYFSEALGQEKLGATLLPGEVNRPATPELWAGVLLFNRASSSNQTRLALHLAHFLTNIDQQKQVLAAIQYISSNKNVTVNRQLFPIGATLLAQSQSAMVLSIDDTEKLELLLDQSNILYYRVLGGEISPDEAANKLTQTVNRQFSGQQ